MNRIVIIVVPLIWVQVMFVCSHMHMLLQSHFIIHLHFFFLLSHYNPLFVHLLLNSVLLINPSLLFIFFLLLILILLITVLNRSHHHTHISLSSVFLDFI